MCYQRLLINKFKHIYLYIVDTGKFCTDLNRIRILDKCYITLIVRQFLYLLSLLSCSFTRHNIINTDSSNFATLTLRQITLRR